MDRLEALGVIISTIGMAVGGTLWLVLAGAAVGSAVLAVLPSILALLCVLVVYRLYRLYPARRLGIVGIAMLWITSLNFLFGNIVFPSIPPSFMGMSTGKDQISIMELNALVGVLSLLGFYFLLQDILSSKGSAKHGQ